MSMMQQVSIPEMLNQSVAIITNPSVGTFERYERHGNLTNAAVYVAIAAVITGVLNIVNGVGVAIASIILSVVGFFVFTGLIFYIGRQFFGGTGNWDEVAYTFSLFWAPLAVVGGVLSLLSAVPILGFLAGLASLVVLVINCFFAYLAVQSSMNILNQGNAIITLVGAFIGMLILNFVVGLILSPLLLFF